MSDPNYTLQLKDENRTLKSELDVLKTDNQLLREQIRVGDVAFNHQHGELEALRERVKEAEWLIENPFKYPVGTNGCLDWMNRRDKWLGGVKK